MASALTLTRTLTLGLNIVSERTLAKGLRGFTLAWHPM